MASNTPFRFYKGQTFAGGVRVPLLLSWPAGLSAGGLRDQYQYATDLTPTILDLVGVPHPSTVNGTRHGVPVKDIDGVSFAPVLGDASHPSTRPEQYAEFGGNRGLYRDGWKILTNHRPGTPFEDAEWELYHVDEDPNEIHDLAGEFPDLVRDLAARWERLAWENTVFPLNDHSDPRAELRRPADGVYGEAVTLLPGTPKLERWRSSRLTQLRSFEVVIDVTVAEGIPVSSSPTLTRVAATWCGSTPAGCGSRSTSTANCMRHPCRCRRGGGPCDCTLRRSLTSGRRGPWRSTGRRRRSRRCGRCSAWHRSAVSTAV
ncbi:sulfatase/phosphatase domain-containing protein [Corynebacterium variabile]|uniref:sulfatase/phosphatase domain-containing protein n=1 Tax=Corynebacterium variabile TaxID=1727 RepID=UPI003F9C5021